MKQFTVVISLIMFLITNIIFAQNSTSRSISQVIGPDGKITNNVQGNFNAEGFKMNYDATGAPVFVASDSGNWTPIGGHPPDLNGAVNDIVIDGTDIYVGGTFTDAGENENADYVAKWNGEKWEALGAGLNRPVFSLAMQGTDLYVGGEFTDAGGNTNADFITKWNGSNWEALEKGVNLEVYSIEIDGGSVYVGGNFTRAGDSTDIKYIGKWNGINWERLGSAINGTVYAIGITSTGVYAGGFFWDGNGAETNPDFIAKWNGSSWEALGTGITKGTNSWVRTIAVDGINVYVGGLFPVAGGVENTANLAKWDEEKWESVGPLPGADVNEIMLTPDGVYVGGNFINAGGDPNADYVVKWNGEKWESLGLGVNSVVGAGA